jgi:tRNA threonylcarbamoyladenosine biosynthesis protein TsaB
MAAISVLAIECATEVCSVALIAGGQVWEKQVHSHDKHSETLLPMVRQVLDDADCSTTSLTLVAAGIGPGSFTGVRTAVSVAQGLALGWNLPLMGVGTLEALALCSPIIRPQRVLVMLDARMSEVYASVMDVDPATAAVVSVQAATVLRPAQLAQWLNTPVDQAVTSGCQGYADAMGDLPYPSTTGIPLASQIARIAVARYLQTTSYPIEDCQPLYVRNHVALTIKERELLGRAA